MHSRSRAERIGLSEVLRFRQTFNALFLITILEYVGVNRPNARILRFHLFSKRFGLAGCCPAALEDHYGVLFWSLVRAEYLQFPVLVHLFAFRGVFSIDLRCFPRIQTRLSLAVG